MLLVIQVGRSTEHAFTDLYLEINLRYYLPEESGFFWLLELNYNLKNEKESRNIRH